MGVFSQDAGNARDGYCRSGSRGKDRAGGQSNIPQLADAPLDGLGYNSLWGLRTPPLRRTWPGHRAESSWPRSATWTGASACGIRKQGACTPKHSMTACQDGAYPGRRVEARSLRVAANGNSRMLAKSLCGRYRKDEKGANDATQDDYGRPERGGLICPAIISKLS
jgi:hypothetical protein